MSVNKVEFKNITKVFPGVRALNNVSFVANGGEAIAFVGENGAGKSTLLKILNGDFQATSGKYLIDDEEVTFAEPKEAIEAGISIIYQERQLIPEVSVAENIYVGELPKKKNGLLDYNLLFENTQKLIDEFGLPLDAREKVKDISIAHQQMIEILKAYKRNSRIIAFDEPTASLTTTEIKILFDCIRKMKEEGKIIMYVSHRMKEIDQIADSIVVFKDGQLVRQLKKEEATPELLIKLMVGRNLGDIFNELKRNEKFGEVILEAKNISTKYVHDINFTLKKGEVLGFSGLVGSGRTEVMKAVFGVDHIIKGELLVNGKKVNFKSPEDAMKERIALCPEDRKEEGILPNLSVRENISVSILDKLVNRLSFINREQEIDIAESDVKKLNIKTPSIEKKIVELSGGNQQKTIIARWLDTNPQVLILDEPTKGIDVGAKSEFYKLICECAKEGIGVIVISSEMPEIIGLADRIIVMKDGTITGEVMRKDANEESILALAMLDD